MKRTTITLPDELAAAVEREAHRRRVSLFAVVREALVAHVGFAGGGMRPPDMEVVVIGGPGA